MIDDSKVSGIKTKENLENKVQIETNYKRSKFRAPTLWGGIPFELKK